MNDIWGQTGEPEWDKTVWESDLEGGLRLLRLGVETHAITSHFALPLLIKSPGGLVIEMTDGTDEYNADQLPRLVLLRRREGRGQPDGVRAGARARTSTARPPYCSRPAGCGPRRCSTASASREENWRDATETVPHFAISESPSYVGRAVAALAADPDVARWNGKSTSSGELAQVYDFTDLDGSQPDAWRYIVEVQDPGKPADTTGYR